MEAKWHSPVPILSKELCLTAQTPEKVGEEEKGNDRDVSVCTYFFLQSSNSIGIVAKKEDSVFVTCLGYCKKKKNPYLIYCSKGKALKHIIKDFIPFTNSQTLSVDI